MMGKSLRPWIAAAPVIALLGAVYAVKGGTSSLFLFLLACSIALVGGFTQLSGPRKVEIQRTWSPLSPLDGEDVEVTVHVRLIGGIPPLWVQVEDCLAGDEQESGKLLFSGFRRNYSGTYRLDGVPRGVYTEGTTRIAWGDVFGWFKRSLYHQGSDKLLVQPLPLRMFSSDGLKGRDEDGSGELSAESTGLASFWDSRLRGYEAGDPLKFIHWKSSARRGELISRVPEEISEPPSCLLLDTDRKSYSAEGQYSQDEQARQEIFEIAISAAAAWLHRESRGAEGFQLCLWPGNRHLQLSGKEGLYKGLEVLAHAQLGADHFDPSLRAAELGNNPAHGQRITVITGYLTSSLVARLLQMADAGAVLDLWCAGELSMPMKDGIAHERSSSFSDKSSFGSFSGDGPGQLSAQLRKHGIHIVPLLNYTSTGMKLETGGGEHGIA
ncbi:DUF58 domain-containing protein [Paenibacillus lentus]|uniref:DUF58 domain-containing protein n=1 Tax=Paenibacillus lentus TaxID=1338368 RepID=UPI00366569F8